MITDDFRGSWAALNSSNHCANADDSAAQIRASADQHAATARQDLGAHPGNDRDRTLALFARQRPGTVKRERQPPITNAQARKQAQAATIGALDHSR
jgi:hypothetical protein